MKKKERQKNNLFETFYCTEFNILSLSFCEAFLVDLHWDHSLSMYVRVCIRGSEMLVFLENIAHVLN